MTDRKEPAMGRFSVEVELSNHKDVVGVELGAVSPDKVRRVKARGVVDSGSTRLIIPQAIADQLGLQISGSTKVRHADGRTANRGIAQDVHLAYAGRESVFSAVVEPHRQSILIGAIMLEELDLVVDCVTGRLVPQDPKQIVSEAEGYDDSVLNG